MSERVTDAAARKRHVIGPLASPQQLVTENNSLKRSLLLERRQRTLLEKRTEKLTAANTELHEELRRCLASMSARDETVARMQQRLIELQDFRALMLEQDGGDFNSVLDGQHGLTGKETKLELKTRIATINEVLLETQGELQVQREKMRTLEVALGAARNQMQILSDENGNLNATIDSLHSKIGQMQHTQDAADGTRTALIAEIQNLEKRVVELGEEISSLRDTVSWLEDAREAEETRHSAERDEWEKQMGKLIEQKCAQTARIDEQRENLECLGEQLVKMKDELQRFRLEIRVFQVARVTRRGLEPTSLTITKNPQTGAITLKIKDAFTSERKPLSMLSSVSLDSRYESSFSLKWDSGDTDLFSSHNSTEVVSLLRHLQSISDDSPEDAEVLSSLGAFLGF